MSRNVDIRPIGHRRAVRLFHCAEIREISPLHGFLGIGGRTADIALIKFAHRDEVFERAHLLRQLLALANYFVGWPHIVDLSALFSFDFKQSVDAVKRHAPIVTDDPAAAVSVRQAGDDSRLPTSHDFWRVGVEHAIVMRLAIFGESLMNIRVGFKAGRLETGLDHTQPAERKNGAFERLVGLQPDNHLILFVDIAGLMRQHGCWRLRIDGEHALFLFVAEIRLQFFPDRLGPL
jgi:hypothetical protein